MFDLNAFLDQTIDTPMATRMQLVPEGEYLARVGGEPDDIKVESIQGRKDPSKQYVRLTLMWDIIDENLRTHLGRDKIRVRDQFLVDTDQITGQLKTGKEDNISLGQRRAALGLNEGVFSISMFRNAGPALIKITHRPNQDDPSRPYPEVSRVTAAA